MMESLRVWLRELEGPLPALSARQRWLLASVCAIAALSRLVAISRSLWDSDEARFALAVREYDVAGHRPHPPGFPLFIAMARLAGLAGFDEFRSLQIVVVVAAMLLAPAMFTLCRELRASYAVSLAGAALLVFLPNVWFYGGTAFSDVPAVTLLVAAIALLLRAFRSAPAVTSGAILLGMAASIRPQCLLIGAVPIALLAVSRRAWRAALALLVVLAIAATSYSVAAQATGWQRYADALRAHRQYIAATDSFRSEIRPPLHRLADDFFVRPFRAPFINAALSLLIIISLASAFRQRRVKPLVLSIVFAPFCILAWLTLDHFSASRFSIGYAPLTAFLAADGLSVLSRGRRRLVGALTVALVSGMTFWTWPALTEVRRNLSPPVRAFETIRGTGASRLAVAVDPRLEAHARLLLSDLDPRTPESRLFAPWRRDEKVLILREEFSTRAGARLFARPHGRLWWLARQRYFDVSMEESAPVTFGEGWYEEESLGEDVWRWMGRRGVITLPGSSAPARLQLSLRVPIEALPRSPAIAIRFNGVVVDEFEARSPVEVRDIALMPTPGKAGEVVIETTKTAGIAGDPRELGVRLEGLRWPVGRSELEVHWNGEPRLDAFPVFDRR
jgi:hypothetical protein